MPHPLLHRVYTVNRWFLALARAKYPQWLTAVLGAGGVGVGYLFLTVPERFNLTPAFSDLLYLLPAVIWGMLFFGVGTALITVSWVKPASAGVLCVALGLTFFLFTISTFPAALAGVATGVSTVLTTTLGFLCFIGMLASLSPQIDRM